MKTLRAYLALFIAAYHAERLERARDLALQRRAFIAWMRYGPGPRFERVAVEVIRARS